MIIQAPNRNCPCWGFPQPSSSPRLNPSPWAYHFQPGPNQVGRPGHPYPSPWAAQPGDEPNEPTAPRKPYAYPGPARGHPPYTLPVAPEGQAPYPFPGYTLQPHAYPGPAGRKPYPSPWGDEDAERPEPFPRPYPFPEFQQSAKGGGARGGFEAPHSWACPYSYHTHHTPYTFPGTTCVQDNPNVDVDVDAFDTGEAVVIHVNLSGAKKEVLSVQEDSKVSGTKVKGEAISAKWKDGVLVIEVSKTKEDDGEAE